MICNYLKIAFRNLIKNKSFSLINIFGLSLSMSVCLLIISIIAGLRQYDRFHTNYDHIFRVLSKNSNQSTYSASAPMPVRNTLMKEYAGIRNVVTFKKGFGGDASFENTTVPLFGYFCSEELFDVFSFKLLKGNPETALRDPFSVILTQKSAKKLFGTQDPFGKIIRFSERGLVVAGIPNKNKPTFLGDYTVTGILSGPDGNTHLEFDILASLSTLPLLELQGKEKDLQANWEDLNQCYHYVLLDPSKDEAHLQSVLNEVSNRQAASGKNPSVILQAQPLSKITPGKMYRNPFSYRLPIQVLYFMGLLAMVVILSVCFNYTNLSLAKSLSRAREVGIRKVSGALKHQIIAQFVGESILISVVSLLIAIGILQLLMPAFRSLWFTQYIHVDMAGNLSIYLLFFAFSIIIGIIAGIIPAFYLSSFKPLKVLKDIHGIKIFRKVTLRKTLIITQFAVSLFFIITTLLIHYQLHYLVHSEYGFEKKNIINVPLQGNQYENFANLVRNHSGISGVSGSSMVLATGGTSFNFLKNRNDPNDSTGMSELYADRNFIDNFGLSFIAGSNFPRVPDDESWHYILINQEAVKKLGYADPHDILNETFNVGGTAGPLTVVGVVKDFHYTNLIQEVGPLMIRNDPDKFRFVNIRFYPGNEESVLTYLEQKWKEMDNGHIFESQNMEQQVAESHAIFGDIGYIIGFISVLAISIACLGLLGMVIYITQSKVKEIGIRKVHGASIQNAVWILSKGFLTMLMVAIFIATPLAKMINDLWLQEFAVRVDFGFEILLAGVMIMAVLGFLTIFSQTLKSARRNPVETLRYE